MLIVLISTDFINTPQGGFPDLILLSTNTTTSTNTTHDN